MRIAYLVNKYPAVSHSFIRREIAALEAAGCSIARFSIRGGQTDLPERDDLAELEKTRVVLSNGLIPLFWETVRVALRYPRGFWSAARLAIASVCQEPRRGWRNIAYLMEACWLTCRLGDAEHLHAHFGTNPAAVARLVSRIAGITFSFTVHGPDEFDAPQTLDLAGKIAEAEIVVAISSYGRSQLMRWSATEHWPKIVVVRCGVDSLFTKQPPTVGRSAPVFCCVARLSAQKGLPILMEATALLAARGRDFSLVLVGDGEMRRDLDAMIERRSLTNIVTITGYLSGADVRAHLLAAKVMVLPSFAEGLPVVIMEALALGTPVIASAIAGIPELVDAHCGWLVPAGSVDLLVNAMEEALVCPAACLAEKGRVGRDRVLASYDAKRNGSDLADVFRAIT